MSNFERIKQVIQFIGDHQQSQPSLDEISEHVGLSPFHLQRLFVEWAGVTPKSFLKCLTIEHAKSMLVDGASVLDATLDSGLSGPGRLHDLCVTIESASPGEIKSGGNGLSIQAGFASSPFGNCLFGENERGICHLSFESSSEPDFGIEKIKTAWPNSTVQLDNEFAATRIAHLFVSSSEKDHGQRLKAFVKGTQFQLQVWRALLRLPTGFLTTYSQIAKVIGSPKSQRAVGTAIGNNPIAYLIPCHRVIRNTGAIGEYRWGASRKKAIIAWEACKNSSHPTSQ